MIVITVLILIVRFVRGVRNVVATKSETVSYDINYNTSFKKNYYDVVLRSNRWQIPFVIEI